MFKKKFDKKKAKTVINKLWLYATVVLVCAYAVLVAVNLISNYKTNKAELVKNSVIEYNKKKFGYTNEDELANAFNSVTFRNTNEFIEIESYLEECSETFSVYEVCDKVYFKIKDFSGDLDELDTKLCNRYVAGWDCEDTSSRVYYYGTPNVPTSTFDEFPNRLEFASTTLDESIQHLTQIVYSGIDTLYIDTNYGTYLVSGQVSSSFKDSHGKALDKDEFYIKCASIYDCGYPSDRMFNYLDSYHNISKTYNN